MTRGRGLTGGCLDNERATTVPEPDMLITTLRSLETGGLLYPDGSMSKVRELLMEGC